MPKDKTQVGSVSSPIGQALEAGRQKGMVQGIALCCQIIWSSQKDSQMIEEILKATGLGIKEMRKCGVEKYDLDILLAAQRDGRLILKP